MSKYTGTSFPAEASRGDDFFHTTVNVIYRFLGGDPLDPLNWYIWDGVVSTDPDTTGWGTNQDGSKWYNKTDHQWKGWNGTEIVLIG